MPMQSLSEKTFQEHMPKEKILLLISSIDQNTNLNEKIQYLSSLQEILKKNEECSQDLLEKVNGSLRKALDENHSKKEHRIEPSIFPPIGIPNKSCNCFLNALCQFFLFVPAYREAFIKNEEIQARLPELSQTLLQIFHDQVNKKTVSEANTQKLREAISKVFISISPSSSRQEDAHEVLSLLFRLISTENRNVYFKKIRTKELDQGIYPVFANDNESVVRKEDNEPEIFIEIQKVQEKGRKPRVLSFEEHLEIFFNNPNLQPHPDFVVSRKALDGEEYNYRVKSEKVRFDSAPQYLLINLKRFTYSKNTSSSGKINDLLSMPIEFTMPKEFVNEEKDAAYVLYAAIEHIGSTLSSGHYVFYGRMPNGQYVRCSDEHISYLSEEQMEQSSKTTYIHCYRRIDDNS
jgi:uncharacterized UBP type Zn finger protein